MRHRIQAALLHLAFSFILISGSAGILILYFYPGIFQDIGGVSALLKILVPLDIALGPMLTFVVFKKGKRGLKFDLWVIVTCQVIALSYGCWSVYSTRPGFLVFYYDTFYVAPPTIDQMALLEDTTRQSLYVGKFDQPRIVNFVFDIPVHEQLKLATESLASGLPVQFIARFFQPLDTISKKRLLKSSIPMEHLKKKTQNNQLLEQLAEYEASNMQYAYIPVLNGNYIKTIVINIPNKQIIDVLDISPY